MDRLKQTRWLEARKRMRPHIDAVFWQELAVSSPEREVYVDWILDKIIKNEYNAALYDEWTVWRQDDHGGRFAVQSNLSYDEASKLLAKLESGGGHKQFYWYEPAATVNISCGEG
jgi:hypothetical protein